MLLSRRERKRQGGQIIILFELVLIVILGFVALVVDLGFLRNDKQILVNTMDSAALAGGSVLPVTSSKTTADANGPHGAQTAKNLIDHSIAVNYPGLTGYTIVYKCLIGADATGPLISRDIPGVCDPHNALGHTAAAADFKGAGPTRVSICDPWIGDTCNTVVITGAETTQYHFAPALGVAKGSSGAIQSAACRGPCGAASIVPVDLMVILDRTGSMSGTASDGANKITSLQNAAKAVLSVYDPAKQRVGLTLTGPGKINSAGTPISSTCGSGTAYGVADDKNFSQQTTLASTTTTLTASMTSSITTVKVASAAAFPSSGVFSILIGSEQMRVTGGAGSLIWTVVRAQNGTNAASHSSNSTVSHRVGSTDTAIVVGAPYTLPFPSTNGFHIEIDTELMTVTGGAGTTFWTVTRSYSGSPVAVHNAGATVYDADPWTPDSSTDGVWIPVGLSGTDIATVRAPPSPTGTAGIYSVAGTPSTSSDIVKSINCIGADTNGTNLSTPIQMAQWYLDHYGRKGVTQGIILETDGHPQVGFDSGGAQAGTNYAFTCDATVAAAKAAKADTTNSPDGIQIFTVGYGVTSSTKCPTRTTSWSTSNSTNNMWESTTWSNASATTMLQTVATDANHYFENPSSTELKSVFAQAATTLMKGGAHLVQLYPIPVVTSASGAVTSVTIGGKYFTGVTSVTFGSGSAVSFTPISDTQITARAPVGAKGSTVDVIVTTGGGTSVVTSLDKYTYP